MVVIELAVAVELSEVVDTEVVKVVVTKVLVADVLVIDADVAEVLEDMVEVVPGVRVEVVETVEYVAVMVDVVVVIGTHQQRR